MTNKADERLEHLLMVLKIILALMKGHSSNLELKEVIRILEALKSENRAGWKPHIYLADNGVDIGDMRIGHNSGVLNYDFAMDKLILNEGEGV